MPVFANFRYTKKSKFKRQKSKVQFKSKKFWFLIVAKIVLLMVKAIDFRPSRFVAA